MTEDINNTASMQLNLQVNKMSQFQNAVYKVLSQAFELQDESSEGGEPGAGQGARCTVYASVPDDVSLPYVKISELSKSVLDGITEKVNISLTVNTEYRGTNEIFYYISKIEKLLTAESLSEYISFFKIISCVNTESGISQDDDQNVTGYVKMSATMQD